MPYELVRLLNSDHPYRYDGTSFGGTKLWTPAQITTALWLDADSPSSITLNGSTVSQWNDKSGNGRHATQATAANQPAYSATGFNGKPAVAFDGINDYIVTNAADYSVGAIFLVYKLNGFSSNRQIYSCRTSPNAILAAASDISFALGCAEYNATKVANFAANSSYAALNGNQVNTADFNNYLAGALTDTNWTINTNQADSATAAFSGTKTFVLGCDIFSSSRVANVNIAEMVICQTVLSTSDRQRAEGYLAWKWNTQASLPADHPYKSLPPTA